MSKHTPGPWAFMKDEGGNERPVNIATVAWCEDYCIGREHSQPHFVNYEAHGNAEDDARLIAAAPDLLEALQAALPFMEDEWGHYSELSAGWNCLKLARSAIRKATEEA